MRLGSVPNTGKGKSQKLRFSESSTSHPHRKASSWSHHYVLRSDKRNDSVQSDHLSVGYLENLERGINPAAIILPESATEQFREIPDSLRYLNGTDYLFFKSCKKFPPEVIGFNPKNKREAWNINGRTIYYLGEGKYTGKKTCRSTFAYEVVDYTGNPLISVEGSQLFLGLKSSVTVFSPSKRVLGKMSQGFLGSTYLVQDCTGRSILKIQGPCFGPCSPCVFWCCNENFEICMIDGVTDIGKITKFWGDEAPDYKRTLGIQFDDNVDVRVKAIIFGCFFLIEYQYFRRGGNGVCLVLLAFTVIAAFLTLLFTNCFGSCEGFLPPPENKTFSVK